MKIDRAVLGYVGALILLIVALLIVHFSAAHAHDHNRPALDSWFKGLRSNAGAACCDGSDALRLDDIDWEAKDGHYRVQLQGEWVDVPKDAVIDGPNLAGPAMVWPFYLDGKLRGVRCFIPGTLS